MVNISKERKNGYVIMVDVLVKIKEVGSEKEKERVSAQNNKIQHAC